MRSLLIVLVWLIIPSVWSQTIETIVGNGINRSSDGPIETATVANPFGVVRGPDGDIWFCEYDSHRVRKITQDGKVITLVGTGEAGYSGDGGDPLDATLNRPHEIRFDSGGRLFIADMSNHVVRMVDFAGGVIQTVVGNGEKGFSGDQGSATAGQLNNPHSIQFGPDGRLYIADVGNHRVRVVDMQTGAISTFAGTGNQGPTPDGARYENVPLLTPRTLDFDHNGHMWLALKKANQVFRLDIKHGTIHHIAGNGDSGFAGNGGEARHATLAGPKGLAIAPNGDVFIADTESHSIRRINVRTGIIDVVVGTGMKFNGRDGDPLKCGLARPHGVFVERDGSVLIGDSENHKIKVLRF